MRRWIPRVKTQSLRFATVLPEALSPCRKINGGSQAIRLRCLQGSNRVRLTRFPISPRIRRLEDSGSLRFAISLPRTKADRDRLQDPRASIEERYSNRTRYGDLIRNAAAGLVRQRYVLAEDVDVLVERAMAHWDWTIAAATSSSLEVR
jgi:hypothetical protein